MRISPTRMELLRTKKRTQLATKGHKLLRDKRDGLMREFLSIVREAKSLRAQVDELLLGSLKHFLFAQASMLPEAVAIVRTLTPYEISLEVSERITMGVKAPEFTVSLTTNNEQPGVWETSRQLDVALVSFQKLLPLLLKLATVEKTAELLAKEIEVTRRRVNALEYVLLPQLKSLIKYIRMKLDEQERAAIMTVMNVKRNMQKRSAQRLD